MVNNSSKNESITHSAIGAMAFGGGASITQYFYNQELMVILSSGSLQALSTLVNGYLNLRIYNTTKKKVFELTNNSNISKLSGSTLSGLETFAVTLVVQKLAGGEGIIGLAALYGFISFTMLPTVYENNILKESREEKKEL